MNGSAQQAFATELPIHSWQMSTLARLYYTQFSMAQVALEAQRNWLMDMIMEDRDLFFHLRILLFVLFCQNEDQRCYDFIRSQIDDNESTPHDRPQSEELDHRLAQIYSKKHPGGRLRYFANGFESIHIFCGGSVELWELVCITLLKLKMFIDLMEVQKITGSFTGNMSSAEAFAAKQSAIPKGSIIQRTDILRKTDHTSDINTVRSQALALVREVKKRNEFFWPTFLSTIDPIISDDEARFTAKTMFHILRMVPNVTRTLEAFCKVA